MNWASAVVSVEMLECHRQAMVGACVCMSIASPIDFGFVVMQLERKVMFLVSSLKRLMTTFNRPNYYIA